MSANEMLDRRRNRTREAIRAAFLELLFEKTYAAVTMAAVAARANIGRSTLYEHFRTKADLLSDGMVHPMSALASVVGAHDIPAHLGWWLQHLREKQALGRVLFYMPASEILLSVLSAQVEIRLNQMNDADTVPSVPMNLVAAQIAAAQFAVLTPWILGRVALSHAAVAQALHRSSNSLAQAMLAQI